MSNFSTNEEILSTPERKKRYIQNWLEVNPFVDASLSIDFDREVTPEPIEKCTPKTSPSNLTILEQNQSISTPTMSPVLGGKRLASSPIIGGRRKPKRIKLIKPSMKCTKETKPLDKQINVESKCDKTLILEKTLVIEKTSVIEKTLVEKTLALNDDTSRTETNNALNLNKSYYDSTLSIKSERKFNKNSIMPNVDSCILKISDSFDQYTSQIVDPESEEKSCKSSALTFLETNSDSDKTPSDLIEDISSQIIIKSPHKIPTKPFQQLSQVISNPSSDSSDSAAENHITESTNTQPNINLLPLGTLKQSDDIDSPSSLNSKLNSSKTLQFLQPVSNKPQKRKKNPKKGSLLDSLLVAMTKERTNVNLLRHRLHRNPTDISEEKPFIILKIIHHLPLANENQLLMCRLIEDKMDLLKNLIENKNDLVSIINVPEISCTINVSLKPLLKVYQPWTILDSNQPLLHISRFIAIPADNTEESEINNGSSNDKCLNILHEFHCPCINRKVLSSDCKFKFQDGLYDITKIIFDDQS